MRSMVALALWSSASACLAESIQAYKSVHTDGTTGYSDTRPASASTVEAIELPQHDTAILEQGDKRMQEMQEVGKHIDEQRAEQSKATRKLESTLAQARQELSDAQQNLTSALESRKNATPERIAAAEERVKLAQKRLREIEGSAR